MEGLAARDGSWARGSDADVRQALEAELARLEKADAFSALGVPPDGDDRQVRAAFLRATKVLHPNRFARRDRQTARIANEVYLRVKDAYQLLQRPEQRDELRARLGVKPAAKAAAEPAGKPAAPAPSKPAARPRRPSDQGPSASMRARTSADAIKKRVLAREQAIEAEFDEAKAMMQRGDHADAEKRFHKLAVEHTTEKRYRVWLHYAKGVQRAAEGDAERARNEYRRALDLMPGFGAAEQALAQLPSVESPAKKGLFARLFGK